MIAWLAGNFVTCLSAGVLVCRFVPSGDSIPHEQHVAIKDRCGGQPRQLHPPRASHDFFALVLDGHCAGFGLSESGGDRGPAFPPAQQVAASAVRPALELRTRETASCCIVDRACGSGRVAYEDWRRAACSGQIVAAAATSEIEDCARGH